MVEKPLLQQRYSVNPPPFKGFYKILGGGEGALPPSLPLVVATGNNKASYLHIIPNTNHIIQSKKISILVVAFLPHGTMC